MKRFNKGDSPKGRPFKKTGSGSPGSRKTFRKEDKPGADKKRSPARKGTRDEERSYGKKSPIRTWEKKEDQPSDKRPTRKFGPKKEERTFGRKNTTRSWDKKEEQSSDKRPARNYGPKKEERSFGRKSTARSWDKKEDQSSDKRPARSYGPKKEERSFGRKNTTRSWDKKEDQSSDKRPARNYGPKKEERSFGRKNSDRTWEKREDKPFRKPGARKTERPEREEGKTPRPRKTIGEERRKSDSPFEQYLQKKRKPEGDRPRPMRPRSADKKTEKKDDGLIRLNKYISNAGICSRREADEFILTGVVKVNGEVITELGHKIRPTDKVVFGDRLIRNEKPVYVLLNKPKDYITTSKDPQNRKTVMDLIADVKERVYPVGRLDRNTTGLLLLTNDGEMADKLMHPRKKVVKIYHVELDKKITAKDLEALTEGITLEDGFFKPDVVSPVEGHDRHHIGLEIHSGRNRIVRRLMEHLGYEVVKLDRVIYAGLTKKGLPRGEWRFLKDEEVNMLKMIG